MENINYPAPKQEYKVLVRCFTFNHSKYIEDAINGFAMQQTNFSFVCLVVDDASTDGEQDVIKAWMERECDMSRAETIDIPTSVVIIVPHKINSSCIFAFYLMNQNLYKAKEEKMRHVTPWREKCKYEALCEGDDYWIDPLKLQKQVDFLEANPEYSMIHTAFQCVDKNSQCLTVDNLVNEISLCVEPLDIKEKKKRDLVRLKTTMSYMDKSESGFVYYKLLATSNYIMTVSVMMRKSVVDNIPCNGLYFDYGVFLVAARLGYVGYLSDVTSCYRFTPGSVISNPKTLAVLGIKKQKLLLYEITELLTNCNFIDDIYTFPKYKTLVARVLVGLLKRCDLQDKIRILFLIIKHVELYIPFCYSLAFTPNLVELYGQLRERC